MRSEHKVSKKNGF